MLRATSLFHACMQQVYLVVKRSAEVRGRRPGDGHTTLTVLPQGFLDKYDYESRTPCVDGVQCSTELLLTALARYVVVSLVLTSTCIVYSLLLWFFMVV